MDKENWDKLTFFEQLSNIDGDVERLIRAHNRYKEGKTDSDQGFFYLENIERLTGLIFEDPKNKEKGYREKEIRDEIDELKGYLNDEYTDDYVRRYWKAYTRAIS